MKLKFCLDRREGTVAVCLPEEILSSSVAGGSVAGGSAAGGSAADGSAADSSVTDGDAVYRFDSAALGALREGDLFTAVLLPDGTPTQITPLPEETAARRAEAQRRLCALFNRKTKRG